MPGLPSGEKWTKYSFFFFNVKKSIVISKKSNILIYMYQEFALELLCYEPFSNQTQPLPLEEKKHQIPPTNIKPFNKKVIAGYDTTVCI